MHLRVVVVVVVVLVVVVVCQHHSSELVACREVSDTDTDYLCRALRSAMRSAATAVDYLRSRNDGGRVCGALHGAWVRPPPAAVFSRSWILALRRPDLIN